LAHFDGERRAARAIRYGRWSRFASASGLVASAGLTACTELAPGDDTLARLIGKNLPDAAVGDPRWSCLDQPDPNSADQLVPTVDLAIRVADTVTNAIPAELSARGCDKLDVLCDVPLVAPVSPSEDGTLHLTVAQGFDGYIEITSPTTVSTMYFVNRPLRRNTSRSFAIISTRAFAGLAMQASIVLEPALGHVLIYVFDCMGEPASDIQLVNASGGIPFVFVDGLPNLGTAVTSVAGIGGFVNVPTGYAVLEGHRVDDDRMLGMTNVVVRAGWFSYSDVQPF
jgi:hypothetical protein